MRKKALSDRLKLDSPWYSLEKGQGVRFSQPPPRPFFHRLRRLVQELDKGGLLVLEGPSQGGKSTMMRQIISALITEDKALAGYFFYIPLDVLSYDGLSLKDIVQTVSELSRRQESFLTEGILFLDHIHWRTRWREDLEEVRTAFPKLRWVVSTSMRMVYPHGAVCFHLPLISFAEFLGMVGHEAEIFERVGDGRDLIYRHNPQKADRLNWLFEEYIFQGQYFQSFIHRVDKVVLSPYFVRDYLLRMMIRQTLVTPEGLSDTQGIGQLMFALIRHNGKETSIEDLFQDVNLSKNTVRKYLDVLEDFWLIFRQQPFHRGGEAFGRTRRFLCYSAQTAMMSAVGVRATYRDRTIFPWVESVIGGQLRQIAAGPLYYGRDQQSVWSSLFGLMNPPRYINILWDHDQVGSKEGWKAASRFYQMYPVGETLKVPLVLATEIQSGRVRSEQENIFLIPSAVLSYTLNGDIDGSALWLKEEVSDDETLYFSPS